MASQIQKKYLSYKNNCLAIYKQGCSCIKLLFPGIHRNEALFIHGSPECTTPGIFITTLYPGHFQQLLISLNQVD